MLKQGSSWAIWAGVLVLLLLGSPGLHAQGLVLPAVGPVNQSMGGASVAAPLDAIGALYWNPATLSGLPATEMDFGVQLLSTRSTTTSAIPANAFGPGIPGGLQAGSSDSDTGIYPLPSFGLAWRLEDMPLTLGLGVFTTGGFGVNYRAEAGNSVLSPPPPVGVGVGPIQSELAIMEVVPAVAFQVTERLTIALGPTATAEKLTADPAIFAAPDDANGNGIATYPAATHTRFAWGIGFKAGLYYTLDSGWRFGASIRSNQWLQTLRFHATDELGRARVLRLDLDYPMVLSLGVSYAGWERLLLAADIRYIDYDNTKGFETTGFDATGAVTGLGWKSVMALALGAQYRLLDALALRMGYTFNQNPIPDEVSFFNVAAPALYEHILYLGSTLSLSEHVSLSLAYYHAFAFTVEGPLFLPTGAVPGSVVQNESVIDALTAGVTLRY